MCDSFAALPNSTKDKVMILAKNSDREPNEAQNVTFIPARDYPSDSEVKCTYRTVPQVSHTNALILSRPFWMYGAEMGVNEFGVAIGNEAVFTKEKYHKKNDTLTGMDMLRLALERASSAQKAVEVILALMQKYGQGGSSSMEGTLYYHNSFLVADAVEALILETAGKWWVLKKVENIGSISNCLTIGSDYDKASPGFEDYAYKRGFSKKKSGVNFKNDFSDFIYTHFGKGRIRHSLSYKLLADKIGQISISDIFNVLRKHSTPEPYRPGKKPMEGLCLHYGGLISAQTTGSMVAVLKKDMPPLVFLTGTSAPCLSFFKPHILTRNQKSITLNSFSEASDNGTVELYGSANSSYDNTKLWWKGEDLHRRALLNYRTIAPQIHEIRDAEESIMLKDIEKIISSGKPSEQVKITDNYRDILLNKNLALIDRSVNDFTQSGIKTKAPFWFQLQWKRINKKASMKI